MNVTTRRELIVRAVALGFGTVLSPSVLAQTPINSAAADGMPSDAKASTLLPGFEVRHAKTSGATINYAIRGSGTGLLLLHGYPETHICWRKIAAQLGEKYTVVAADLRGYGDSSKPLGAENHATYSKRAMAQDQVELMASLGFRQFAVVGHDRGGRVAHRMALDHPEVVRKLAIIDIVPTYTLYHSVSKEFATTYFHWFFLIQPAPFPETLIGNNSEYWLREFALDPGAIGADAFAEYLRCFREPAAIHASCEDYRAGATIDLDDDAKDLGQKIACPTLALWAEQGAMNRMFNVLRTWQERASSVTGKALPGGHFLVEDSPQAVLRELQGFLE